jgi:two-component system NtrC family sensor kinase
MGRFSRALERVLFGRDITAELLTDRERLAAELTRRHAELFSLQELAAVLSASMRFDRVVAEVARYAMRALDASGSAVLLAPDEGGAFEVVAAKGVLANHLHRRIDPESVGVALEAIGHEELILRTATARDRLVLFEGAMVRAAVAAPLRAHGETSGVLLVADRLVGEFTDDDARLLSTAATHAAVALANARFFELVRGGKEQWETTFDALAEGIAMVDQHGVIRRANRAIATLARMPITGVVGRDLDETLFGSRQALTSLIREAGEEDRTAAAVHRSERLGRILRLAVSPLANAAGDVAAVVVVEDITEQKKLEGQLLQSEKLASVGTLVSGVAHELNNPLTSIAGLSEFLLEQGVGNEQQREHLRVINDQSERASRIVRNLLSFARKTEGDRAPLDLGDVAQRTVQLMDYELRRHGITVTSAIPPRVPPVIGSRDQLQQVVLNLMTNAAYALAQLPADAPRTIEVTVAPDGDRIVLRLKDSGPGIPTEVAAQIFDPFFTTKPPGEGTGLGLFLSYGIADSHGGTLSVESEPGHGATFVLALPQASAALAATPPAPAPAQSEPVPLLPRRILVVDDDPAVGRLVSALFAHDGHTVDTTATGETALTLAREHAYDLLIVDRHAAVGSESCMDVLRREGPDMERRIIMSTGDRLSNAPADRTRVLRKPFNLRDLRAAAAEVWEADVSRP